MITISYFFKDDEEAIVLLKNGISWFAFMSGENHLFFRIKNQEVLEELKRSILYGENEYIEIDELKIQELIALLEKEPKSQSQRYISKLTKRLTDLIVDCGLSGSLLAEGCSVVG